CFPVLKIFGHTLIKLPSALLHFVPFFNNLRVPTRWGILLNLFLGLYLVRAAYLTLSEKQNRWAALGLLLLVALEYLPRTYSFFPENTYARMAAEAGKQPGEVLLTLPFGVRDGYRQEGVQD